MTRCLIAAGWLMTGTWLLAATDPGEEAAFQQVDTAAKAHATVTTKDALIQADEAASTAAAAYLAKYPQSERAPAVAELWTQTADEMAMMKLPGAPKPEEIAKKLDELAAGAKQVEQKAPIRFVETSWLLDRLSHGLETTPGAWDTADREISAFEKEFGGQISFDGQSSAVDQLRQEEFEALQSSDSPAAAAVMEKLASDKNPEIAQTAQQLAASQKTRLSYLGKPLDLSFKAVDGTTVDLAKLRGKVVLIDFWATWCPPCREVLPSVLAAYKKYHDKGFEIVGISLDQDVTTLNAFTREAGMTWPQACDGQGFDGTLPKKFGIVAIPAMWLVNKKGVLVSQNGREDLDGSIAKLLSAP